MTIILGLTILVFLQGIMIFSAGYVIYRLRQIIEALHTPADVTVSLLRQIDMGVKFVADNSKFTPSAIAITQFKGTLYSVRVKIATKEDLQGMYVHQIRN